jgi:hypothetical protein
MYKARDASDECRRQSDGYLQSKLGNAFYKIRINTGDLMNLNSAVALIPTAF